MSADTILGFPIDPKQVQRIEATHRGFLYQHLYGAACLISFQKIGAKTLITESDEDIELTWPDKRAYIQIKTRSSLLQWNDIKETIDRFNKLRNEHTKNRRSGTAAFIILTNTELGPELVIRVHDKSWPTDVAIQTPSSKQLHIEIPPASRDLAQCLEWCIDKAKEIPLLSISPETLIWKLAATIQYLATGFNDHRIHAEEIPSLLEQLVIQLQHFPEAPQNYRPQEDEPSIKSDDKVRIIVGVSGSGKTAWASQAVLHTNESIAYFDVSDLSESALASSLARELVAQFLGDNKTGAVATILGARSGIDMLRAMNGYFVEKKLAMFMVLDNVHLLSVNTTRTLVKAASNIKFILLTQPWSDLNLLESTLNIKAEELRGWSMDTIAAEFATAQCLTDVDTVKVIKDLTLGIPLFVQNVAQIALTSYGGNAKAFCRDISSRNHSQETSQDLILSKTFLQLTRDALQLAGILSLVHFSLTRSEIDEVSGVIISENNVISSSLRELSRFGIIKSSGTGEMKLHDIFRGLAKDEFRKINDDEKFLTKLILAEALQRSLPSSIGKFGLWIRLLAETNQVKVLADLATFEWFHEIGDPREFKIVLEEACRSIELDGEDRFWALDALAFWDTQDRHYDNVASRVKEMEALNKQADLSLKAKTALAMKQIAVSGFAANSKGIESAFKSAVQLANGDKELIRIISYNCAYAYHHAHDYLKVKRVVEPLIDEYYHHVGLKPSDVFLQNSDHILPIVTRIPTWQDDLKHLADCFDLLASAKKRLGEKLFLEQTYAMKFYMLTHAYPSAIRVGQNVVDQLVNSDPYEARRTIESHLLPIVQMPEFIQYALQVRSQYAVVLAYCGDLDAARSEMRKIQGYEVSKNQKDELDNQAFLIEMIARRFDEETELETPETPRKPSQSQKKRKK